MGRKKTSKGSRKGKAKGTKKRVAKVAVAEVPKGPDFSKFVHLGERNINDLNDIARDMAVCAEQMTNFVDGCKHIFNKRNPMVEDDDEDDDDA